MHSAFAATSRGATLVSALKAKPRDTGTAIRVFIEDEVKAPVMLAETALRRHRSAARNLAAARSRRHAPGGALSDEPPRGGGERRPRGS